jgi:hypothetical protein
LTAVLVSLVAGRGNAAEAVSVRLTDGSTLSAELHPRTNDEHLWLRFGSGRAVILRAVAWDRIAEATAGEETIDAAALRQLAAEQTEEDESISPAEPQSSGEPSDAERARALLYFYPRVKSVDFDVRIANWDQDVEFDGLVLQLYPLDTDGQLTCVRGTLNVELVAPRLQDFNQAPRARGQVVSRLGQWSVAVQADEVTEKGVTVKLPFRTIHPEFDTTWATHGLVHVRLVVPGQGVFEQSFDGVRVRPYAPLRDAMERHNGQRFLPTEQTGFGKRIQQRGGR